jgi:hypothetical protein
MQSVQTVRRVIAVGERAGSLDGVVGWIPTSDGNLFALLEGLLTLPK